MQITAISTWQFFFTLLVLGCAAGIYFLYVRPRIKDTWAFQGFHGKVRPWLKARWDMTLAFVIAVAPIAWNGALDIIIAISLMLPDVLPALAGLDLSALVLEPWVKTSIQIGAVLAPAIRTAMMARKEKD